MIFQHLDRIVFAGDSVTDMGSANPVGEGLFDVVGHGYVRMIENLLTACYPDRDIRVTNSGVSGNTSAHLLERFERDVVNLNPDWVSICIGFNDVWRQFDLPAMTDLHIGVEEYEHNVEQCLQMVQGKCKGIFLLTPYYMEPLREDKMRKRMEDYIAVCKRLAERYSCILVDLQSMFDRFFENHHSAYIAWDRVHPNERGATLIAKEFLSHCDFDFYGRT